MLKIPFWSAQWGAGKADGADLLHCNTSLDFCCALHILAAEAPMLRGAPKARIHEANRGVPPMTAPSFEEFQKFSKQQLEAVNAATATVTKSLQEIAAESSDYSKKAFAASSAVVEKLLGARSVESAIQIQSEFAKSAYEGFIAQASKINEIYVKLASEAFKPVETALATAQGK
jgi:hypothetical protein